MNKPNLYLRILLGPFLLLLAGGCDSEIPGPIAIIRKTDVYVEGRITTDGGAKPMSKMQIQLIRDRPLSLDTDEYFTKTDANGYYRFKFRANHELKDSPYSLYYDIYDVDKDIYYCPSNTLTIGDLPSADTTLVYNFQLPRKTEIQCVFKDPAKAREYELGSIFRFTCGLDSDSTRFMNETGAVSMNYTENPLYIPANTPVIVVTRGIDRKLNKALEKQDTIKVSYGSVYRHEIDF